MKELRFHVAWEDPAGALGRELRATWASLKISVGDDVVTELFDSHRRTEKEQLYVSLYPIAEWIAEHWWHLTTETLTPGRTTSKGYIKRHSLQGSGEGFVMPSLVVQPHGEATRLSWNEFRFPNSPIRFLSSGEAFLDPLQVEHELRGLVDAVILRLESENISNTYLQQEWEAINAVDSGEAEFCRSVAALGLDPFNVSPQFSEDLEELGLRIPAPLAREFFSAAEPSRLNEDLNQLIEGLQNAQRTTVNEVLVQVREELGRKHDGSGSP